MAQMEAPSGSMCMVIVCFILAVQCTTDSAFAPTDMTSAARRNRNKDWIPFGSREYQFVLDEGRRLDKTRDDAKHACLAKKADLVSIETEEELEFIKDQIRIKVREKGQHMLNNDQWWTNGISYKLSHWVWDTPMARQVEISALKRRTVPRQGKHYLALSHPGGWRLKIVPGNFALRYICQRDRSPESPREPTRPSVGNPDSIVHHNLTDSDLEMLSVRLREYIFLGYDNEIPSRLNLDNPDRNVIRMDVDLIQIQDDVSVELLSVKQNIETAWTDVRLSWDPNKYGGMTRIRTPATDVWYPNIKTLYRAGTLREACQNRDPQNLVTISASGYLTLDRSCDVIYNCTLEKPATFPFDHKKCRLLVFIEQDENALVEMTWNREDSTLDRGFHRAWRASSLEGAQVGDTRPTNVTEPFVVAQLTLYLHRNVLYYILTLMVPCIFLSMVLLIILWLPHGSVVKCVTTILVTLAFLIYLVIGGQHTKGRNVSYSDTFMIVMSVIGATALVAQVCIVRLVMRHKKHLPPPLWIENMFSRRSHNKTTDKYKGIKCHEMAALQKENGGDNVRNKWIEEKELMLEEQSLGRTTLGRDATHNKPQSHYVTTSRDQYVTLQRDVTHDTSSTENKHTLDKYKKSQTVTLNNRTTTVHFQDVVHSQIPNGHSRNSRSSQRSPNRVRETSLFNTITSDVCHDVSRDSARASGAESFDSGCHSETKNSPDVTMATPHSMKHAHFKKCIVWFDRTVSLVISTAVIFTIMIFVILFLAT